jgi:heptaprenyl diphosphate synthase
MQLASKEERKYLLAEQPDSGKIRSIWLKYKITTQLYELLEANMSQLQAELRLLESKELSKELMSIGEPIIRYLSAPKVLEEI